MGELEGVGGGRGAELVNQPHYVGVKHRIILVANVQSHIHIPFIMFSILSSLIVCVGYTVHFTVYTRCTV